MANKRYYWLKLKEDFFRQKEIKKLRRIAGGDTYTIIYLKMLLKSLENDGRLYYDGIEDNFVSELALDIDEEPEKISKTLLFLEENDLLSYEGEDCIIPILPRYKRCRSTNKYKEWRKAVFERDNYTCQICFKRGVSLEAHHIEPWAKCINKRFVLDNGITLCKQCHRNLHKNKRGNNYGREG